jgi:hypothetical protein
MSFGQTKLDPSDLVMPRVKIVQQMSDEAQDQRAKPGDFFNTLTGENYGSTLRFVALQPFKQRVMLVRTERRPAIDAELVAAGLAELSEGNGLKCRSFDMLVGQGEPGIECDICPLSKWHEGNKPPFCSETYNVAGTDETGSLIILSFSKSSARVGKQLFSMLRLRPGYPWQVLYEAKTRQEKNDQGTFYVPTVTSTGEAPPTELLTQARLWAEQIAGVQINVTPIDEEEGGGESPAPF